MAKIKVKFYNIDWDTEGQDIDLPNQVTLEITENFDLEQCGANLLSDQYGYCVNSFIFEID
jgi:hypothetical protein